MHEIGEGILGIPGARFTYSKGIELFFSCCCCCFLFFKGETRKAQRVPPPPLRCVRSCPNDFSLSDKKSRDETFSHWTVLDCDCCSPPPVQWMDGWTIVNERNCVIPMDVVGIFFFFFPPSHFNFSRQNEMTKQNLFWSVFCLYKKKTRNDVTTTEYKWISWLLHCRPLVVVVFPNYRQS